jgi:hypothetical protein
MNVLRSLLTRVKAGLTVKALKHDAALFAGFFAASGVMSSGSLTGDAIVAAVVVAAQRTVKAIAAGA